MVGSRTGLVNACLNLRHLSGLVFHILYSCCIEVDRMPVTQPRGPTSFVREAKGTAQRLTIEFIPFGLSFP